MTVVGYQGGEGAFSHIAASRHFASEGGALELRGFPAFLPMLEAVRDGTVDFAILPIENSIAGSINESYDLLARMKLALVGEEIQRIVHCLIGLPGATIEDLRKVISHPVALAQCQVFLGTLRGCRQEIFEDTALAVAKVKADGDPTLAAVASEEAARLHGLPVLRRDIADQPENYTRMVIVGREPIPCPPDVRCKTSLIFSTKHEKGALARAINVFADRGLNLTKLESRPMPRTPFEYVFYLDFEGHPASTEVADALRALGEQTTLLEVLGSYPSGTTAVRDA